MARELIAEHFIDDGSREGIKPGETFTADSDKEAERLVAIGAARRPYEVSAEVTVENNAELAELVKALKVDELKAGLESLQVDFDPAAKKPDLQQAFITACEANPLGASEYLESLS